MIKSGGKVQFRRPYEDKEWTERRRRWRSVGVKERGCAVFCFSPVDRAGENEIFFSLVFGERIYQGKARISDRIITALGHEKFKSELRLILF
ncbi:hypothetical protein L484_007873 [Morus notabilis]|uniref:Uncharacterized protein n=1 Tax=Morus notabilis TaxID=981085 RepID=W9QG22_9ROSA|nr:hypothetical protein L484_007873 [Morus notabilis]